MNDTADDTKPAPHPWAVPSWVPFVNKRPKPAEIAAEQARMEKVLVTVSVRARDFVLTKLHGELKLSCSIHALDTFCRSNSHAVSDPLLLDDLNRLARHLLQMEITMPGWHLKGIYTTPPAITPVSPAELRRQRAMFDYLNDKMGPASHEFVVTLRPETVMNAVQVSLASHRVKFPGPDGIDFRPTNENGVYVIQPEHSLFWYAGYIEKTMRNPNMRRTWEAAKAAVTISPEAGMILADLGEGTTAHQIAEFIAINDAVTSIDPTGTKARDAVVAEHHARSAVAKVTNPQQVLVSAREAALVTYTRCQIRTEVA